MVKLMVVLGVSLLSYHFIGSALLETNLLVVLSPSIAFSLFSYSAAIAFGKPE